MEIKTVKDAKIWLNSWEKHPSKIKMLKLAIESQTKILNLTSKQKNPSDYQMAKNILEYFSTKYNSLLGIL